MADIDLRSFPPVDGVPLSGRRGRGLVAAVSPSDFAWATSRSWSVDDQGYVMGCVDGLTTRLHREIIRRALLRPIPPGQEVDHINGDRLDNRRENLRLVTHAENGQNIRRKGGTSRFRGVCWRRDIAKWQVEVTVGGTRHYGGQFTDEVAAGAAATGLLRQYAPFAEVSHGH